VRSEQKGLGWDTAMFLCPACGVATQHQFHAEHGEYNEIYEIRCLTCQGLQKKPRHDWLSQMARDFVRPSKANLTKYPRIEPHTGEVVNSREDEVRVMKAMGMHAAHHGIDERYNDEACDNLNRRRIEHEKKKRDMAERRRYFGRAR
jgi:hypothetical protein